MKSKVLFYKKDNRVFNTYPFYNRTILEKVPYEEEETFQTGEIGEDGKPVVETRMITRTRYESKEVLTEPVIGYDKTVMDEIIVDEVPTLSGENHTLYVENGKIVSKLDESKVARAAKQALLSQIATKKALLVKYREDVEQVDLFGMERADYAEKKAACKTLVEELRELEKKV